MYDYQDNPTAFIEKIDQSFSSCFDGSATFTNNFVRKIRGLNQTYDTASVNGIILNVASHTLRTDSVIVDALLGNGDALDCYNERLQNEDFRTAYLNNQKTAIGLELFNVNGNGFDEIAGVGKEDRLILSDQYKKLYGACCSGAMPSSIDLNANVDFGGDKSTPTPPGSGGGSTVVEKKYYIGSAQMVFEEFPIDGGAIDLSGELTLLSPTLDNLDPHMVGNGSVTITGTIPSTGGTVTLTGNVSYTYPDGTSGNGTYSIKGEVPMGGGFTEFTGTANLSVTLPDGTTHIEKPDLKLATDVPVTAGGVFALAGPTVQIV